MKFYAVLIFCCAVYYVNAKYCTGDVLKAIVSKCMTEEEATPEDFEDILHMKKALNENSKCFRACVLQECKVMNSTGHIDIEVPRTYYDIITHGDEEKNKIVDNVVQNCISSLTYDGRVCAIAEAYLDCGFTNCKDCALDLKAVLH